MTRVYLFSNDINIITMRVYVFDNDSNISSAMMMAWKEQKCNLKRRRNNAHWITHPKFSMVVRSEFRQEECAEEENKYQTLDLSVEDQQLPYPV
jgi:hypothetical protein